MVGSGSEMLGSPGGDHSDRLTWRLALMALSGGASVATVVLLVNGLRVWAGISSFVAVVALLAGGFRLAPPRPPRLVFVERLMDRAVDSSILAPLVWVTRYGATRTAALALVGLGASYLASYERARGQSLGYGGFEGPGYRAVRVGLLVLGLLTGWIEWVLWAFLALTVTASAVRAWNVVLQERRSSLPTGGPATS
jgi:hypothetical protein